MNLEEAKTLLKNLPELDRQEVVAEWALSAQQPVGSGNAREPYNVPIQTPLEFSLLPQILTRHLKRQNITYDVFLRMVYA